MSHATDFAWLIEAPGPSYLAVRKIVGHVFRWTRDANEALRFHSEEQADAVMMAVRELAPRVFDFEETLGNVRAVEHGWMRKST